MQDPPVHQRSEPDQGFYGRTAYRKVLTSEERRESKQIKSSFINKEAAQSLWYEKGDVIIVTCSMSWLVRFTWRHSAWTGKHWCALRSDIWLHSPARSPADWGPRPEERRHPLWPGPQWWGWCLQGLQWQRGLLRESCCHQNHEPGSCWDSGSTPQLSSLFQKLKCW